MRNSSERTADSETAKQLQIALIQLGASEAREELLKQRIAEKDITIKAVEDGRAQRDIIIEQMKANRADADANRADSNRIDTGDQRMLVACNEQLSKAEGRIRFLEHPPILARIFNPDVLLAGGLGFGLGRWTAPSAGPIQITNPFAQYTVSQNQYGMFQPSPTDKMNFAMKQMKVK